MSVDVLPMALSDGDFIHHLWIMVDHAREIHHLGEVKKRGVKTEFLNGVGTQYRTTRFKAGRRNTRGNAEMDFQRCLFREALHESHSFNTQNVGDLVWVRDSRRRAVPHGDAGEFGWGEHRAFDMHVGIDKARTKKGSFRDRLVLDNGLDLARADFDGAGKDPLIENVHDLSAVVGLG